MLFDGKDVVEPLGALASDARFQTNRARVEHYGVLRPRLAERLRTRTRAAWLAALTAEGIPCGAVRDVGTVMGDPQIAERGMVETVEHAVLGAIKVLGIPVKLSDTPGAVRTAPPTLGQDTERILRTDMGFSDAEGSLLRQQRVVGDG